VKVTPTALRRFHKYATMVWGILLVPTLVWWKESILWVALMSVRANVGAHFAGYQGARAEDSGSGDGPGSDTHDRMIREMYERIMHYEP